MTERKKRGLHNEKKPHTKQKKQDKNMDQNCLDIFYKHISYCCYIQARTEAGLNT